MRADPPVTRALAATVAGMIGAGVGVLGAVVGAALLFEGLKVLLGSPATVEEYHFGTEAMMGNGGFHYANPELYAWTTIAWAVAALTASGLVLAAIHRWSVRPAVSALAIVLVALAADRTAASVEWERRDRRAGALPSFDALELSGMPPPSPEFQTTATVVSIQYCSSESRIDGGQQESGYRVTADLRLRLVNNSSRALAIVGPAGETIATRLMVVDRTNRLHHGGFRTICSLAFEEATAAVRGQVAGRSTGRA